MNYSVFHTDDKAFLEEIKKEAEEAASELLEKARLKKGNIAVIGCSTSEILGDDLGGHSTPEIAQAVFDGINSVFKPFGIYIAAQCCEHLNRAIIIERDAVPFLQIVNAVPQPKAGSSFAAAAYKSFKDPVAVEEIKADGGLDIGGTLIGMHLKAVAVPVRLKQRNIGKAIVLAARVRPKFIGGERAVYDEELKKGY